MLTFKSHESLMRWILIIRCCSDYTLLFGYYHANEQGSMVKNVPSHINMDTHALTRWLLVLNSPGNTAPYFLSPLFPFLNIIHLQCVCLCVCVWYICTNVCLCNTIDLSLKYLGIHVSVNVPLWAHVRLFLLKCNYSCVNRTETPNAMLHY